MTDDLVAVHIHALDGRDIGRSRHIFKDSVQKLLNTFVSVSGTAAYRNGLAFAGSLSEDFLHILNGRLFALEILHHQVIIQLADLLNQLAAV